VGEKYITSPALVIEPLHSTRVTCEFGTSFNYTPCYGVKYRWSSRLICISELKSFEFRSLYILCMKWGGMNTLRER